jgi:hypothetical protein
MKLSGYNEGSIYTVSNGVYTGQSTLDALSQIRPKNPVPADGSGGPGTQYEDSWSVFKVTGIENNAQQTLWSDLQTIAGNQYQITAIVWGENDVYLDQTSVTGGVNQVIRGVDFKFAFWLEKNPTSATSYFGPAAGALDPDSRSDTTPWIYPTINEGTLIWTGVSAPIGPGYDYETSVVVSGGAVIGGAGGAMAGNIASIAGLGAGAWNSYLDSPTSPDIFATFSIGNKPPGSPGPVINTRGFDVVINDPIYTTVIPTPSAIWGGALLAGVAGMSIYRRRRGNE